jgi:type VI secretion system protein ImpK
MPPPALPAEADAALRRFRRFYGELSVVKQLLRESDWATLLGGRATGCDRAEPLFRAVQARLRRAIIAQGATGPAGGIDPGYVMAAIADEALLYDIDWPGRELWAKTPLEAALYSSRRAGDQLSQAIERLAARGAADPAPGAGGLAMTLLLALQMGFRGTTEPDSIEKLKRQLYELVFRTRTTAGIDVDSLVAGAAAKLGGGRPTRPPRLLPWVAASFLVLTGYLAVSWLVWWSQVSDVVDTARRLTGTLRGLP